MPEHDQETLLQMLRDAQFIAARYRRDTIEAADFYAMTEEEQVDYFNTTILPLWESMGSPDRLTEGHLLFQDRLFGRPEKTG